MKIKAEITDDGCSEKPNYPCIKTTRGGSRVVLFTGPLKGIVLIDDDHYKAGESHHCWAEGEFKPLKGKLILSQE